MKRTIYTFICTCLIVIALVCINACKKSSSQQLCGGANPIENLPWLKAKIDPLNSNPYSSEYSYISRENYNGQTFFVLSNCDPAADSIPLFYDCDGRSVLFNTPEYTNIIKQFGSGYRNVIWHGNKSKCNFN